VPCWPLSESSLRSPSVQVGETWFPKCGITRLDRQNRKFPPILTWSKKCYFFVCKRTEFVHQELRDFVEMTLTRVSSNCLLLESNRVILWKMWLKSSWVKFCLNVTRVESESPKIATWVEPSHWHKSRYHWSQDPFFCESRSRRFQVSSRFQKLEVSVTAYCLENLNVTNKWFSKTSIFNECFVYCICS